MEVKDQWQQAKTKQGKVSVLQNDEKVAHRAHKLAPLYGGTCLAVEGKRLAVLMVTVSTTTGKSAFMLFPAGEHNNALTEKKERGTMFSIKRKCFTV